MPDPTSPSFTSPTTITIRRNPPRLARPTPPSPPPPPNSLNVFLRIRPPPKIPTSKSTNTTQKSTKSCILVNDPHSVTVTCDSTTTTRMRKVYKGFSRVFSSGSGQEEVYEEMMRGMVDEFLRSGKSGLLAALGPSGSGKTHTVFGSGKEPGLVPRAIRHIFEGNAGRVVSRSFYLSVFEICSEKGKGERCCDLSADGADVSLQQSVVKGLKEVLIKDVAQAESVLAHAKSKRATAMTNTNSQSSRSQCIISIRCAVEETDRESQSPAGGAVLTFVDLAGAEREKKTGNQGGRLLESNFINNTSMVFGLCLRSLLEHQKNPKKSLQKHFQSSLLTRYLRDYLEGRKRMALILTARSGPGDYFDVSFLLRQASPFMEIKFNNVEEHPNVPGNKRRIQTTCTEQLKRVKLSDADVKNETGKNAADSSNFCKEDTTAYKSRNKQQQSENKLSKDNSADLKLQKQYYFMQGFAKALWNILKQYKERVKALQNEIDILTENGRIEHDHTSLMEKELQYLRSQCSCQKHAVIAATSPVNTNSESPGRALGKLTDHGKEVAGEVQELMDVEHGDKEILDSGVNQFSSAVCNALVENELVEANAPEEETFDDSVVGASEITKSGAKSKCEDSDITLPENGTVECKSFSGPKQIQNGNEELLDPEPSDISMDPLGDCPSVAEASVSANDQMEPYSPVRMPMQEVELPSHDLEPSAQPSEKVQDSSRNSKILHDHITQTDQMESKKRESGFIPSDVTVSVHQSHVMDLKVQGENYGHGTDEEMNKENVANGQRSNLIETAKTSHPTVSKEGRPKRRLMAASSLLLRDVDSLDITDESVKHQGGRGRRRLADNGSQRTRGNASLLRVLLKNQLPR